MAAIIVHGGAHAVSAKETAAHRNGCLKALQAGWKIIQNDGEALDAVECAIKVLENDPTFNAGYGSILNRAGEVEMDAGIMEGTSLQAGAVGALQGVRHPISVARKVLESDTVFLVGRGAYEFAKEQAEELCNPPAMISPARLEQWQSASPGKSGCDTVGCVAMDNHGHIAAGTSTGGLAGKLPGRIGDSPLIGCGLYADAASGACSLTGDGESITRLVLAKTLVDLLHGGINPDHAATHAMHLLENKTGGEGGCIIIDAWGRIGWAHNAANLPCAYITDQMLAPAVFIHKKEEQYFLKGRK